MKCDFCGIPAAFWEFPAPDIVLADTNVISTGAWIACEPCHGYIASDRRYELRIHATKIFCKKFPRVSFLDASREIRNVHAQFFTHRRGNGHPYSADPVPAA